jgi:hypothetical protein
MRGTLGAMDGDVCGRQAKSSSRQKGRGVPRARALLHGRHARLLLLSCSCLAFRACLRLARPPSVAFLASSTPARSTAAADRKRRAPRGPCCAVAARLWHHSSSSSFSGSSNSSAADMNGAANSNSSQAAGAAPGADSPTELRAQIDALKAQLALLDERRERMLKNKPSVWHHAPTHRGSSLHT